MASKRQLDNGVWQYQFQRKGLLTRRVYRNFTDEIEGDAYAAQIEGLLGKGIVPVELTGSKLLTIRDLLDTYSEREILAPSSKNLVPALRTAIGETKVSAINNDWLDTWIAGMQVKLAPSTLKKRVELLARCVDWAMRKDIVVLTKNPMRVLPKGYATKGVDRHLTWVGQRDRRLSADGAEERAIRSVLAEKGCPAELMLFEMALESAMRLREMYTLTKDQVHFNKSTIFLEKTKNGDKRQVPMSSVLKAALKVYMATVEGENLYPWWDGRLDEVYLDGISNRLSKRFAYRFKEAKCSDLRFHDLRHEATSRIYERTTLSDLEIAKITGHKDPRMLSRYANLRGSTLAAKLW